MRITRLEVDINKFNKNIENIKHYVGNKKIMPVIKANAYGTYINKKLDVINQFDIVGVAFSIEGIELRKIGYNKQNVTKEVCVLTEHTIKFTVPSDDKENMRLILQSVFDALSEKGYNPINQIVGYLLTEDPTYITNYQSARSLICKIDRDELLRTLVQSYLFEK